MFGRSAKTEQANTVTVEVFLDQETAKKFKLYTAKKNVDESKGLVEVLERGITNYWLLEFKRLKENYQCIEPLFNEYKKDNETLRKLEEENERLKNILENKHMSEQKVTSNFCQADPEV